ncbi:hypothetical protein YpUG050454_3083 [Yersinia pestis biovar Antiqua str. UG05-0454]|nr:hypothetical protein YpUG050454_3083 [Yersinia pestis biovar Antiqua str. UG05-0454]
MHAANAIGGKAIVENATTIANVMGLIAAAGTRLKECWLPVSA